MNWIDRIIGHIDPVQGLRRDRARRAYERAVPPAPSRRMFGKRRGDFDLNTGNPNDARPKRFMSRQAVLKLVAENPFARKAMNALLNSVIGWGITGAPGGTKAMQRAFAEWIKVCDYRKRRDFYGLQELWARHMFRDGDVFIVKRLVAGVEGIPLRLQTLDRGMLATHKIGKNIERGIEYDDDGDIVVAYHFRRNRKGSRAFSQETVRFAAEDVIHLFHDEYVGQSEGISVFDSVVKRLGDVEEGIEAEVVKANISACLVGFRVRKTDANADEDENIGMPVDSDPDRPPVEELVPGMVETLDPGEEIQFSNPPKTGGIGDLARIALLAGAAGVGITYEQMTGDLSNVNFSSYKAGALEFKRSVGRVQYLTLIPVALDRVWGWFTMTGFEFGHFSKKTAPITWTPPPFESIDRIGDAEADILEMQAGLESRDNLLAARGYDPATHMGQIKAGIDLQKKYGLAFKGDPFAPGQMAASADGERADDALPTFDPEAHARAVARHILRARGKA